jgi:hypothetical protein
MKRAASKRHHATTKKSRAQLDREIYETLAAGRKPPATRAGKHALFYLSEDQTGGRYAEHIERFDNLRDALDMLAQLPAGSITYGNAAEGPKYMLVWAAPAHTDMLYWTDGDLNVLNLIRREAREVKERQFKRYGNLDKRFQQALKK